MFRRYFLSHLSQISPRYIIQVYRDLRRRAVSFSELSLMTLLLKPERKSDAPPSGRA
jgi:hypothetical protein